jgi:hypothetical protein
VGNVDQNVKLRHDSRGVAREASAAGGDGACLAGRKKSHPFGERAYVLLKFAGQRGVAPAIFLVGQVGQLRTPLRKLNDCGTAS